MMFCFQDAGCIRRLIGIYAAEPEHLEKLVLKVAVNPINLNLDSHCSSSLILLSSIATSFGSCISSSFKEALIEQNENQIFLREVASSATAATGNRAATNTVSGGSTDRILSPGDLKHATMNHQSLQDESEVEDEAFQDSNRTPNKRDSRAVDLESTALKLLEPPNEKWIGVNAEGPSATKAIQNLIESINASINLEVELIQIQLWQTARVGDKICCFTFCVEDVRLKGGLTAIHHMGNYCWILSSQKLQQHNSPSLISNPLWWAKFNELDDVFKGSRFSNSSFTSYSFSHLDNSPFKVIKQQHLLGKTISQLLSIFKRRSKHHNVGTFDEDESLFFGDIRKVLWRLRPPVPWMVLQGEVKFHASFLNRLEKIKETLIETVEVRFVGVKTSFVRNR